MSPEREARLGPGRANVLLKLAGGASVWGMSSDADHCPLCGQPNACGMAAGQRGCWCFETDVPREVLERVPEELQGRVCVCRACATGEAAPGALATLGRAPKGRG